MAPGLNTSPKTDTWGDVGLFSIIETSG